MNSNSVYQLTENLIRSSAKLIKLTESFLEEHTKERKSNGLSNSDGCRADDGCRPAVYLSGR